MNTVIVIHIHRTEFEKYKLSSVLPHAHLAKKNGPFRGRLDNNRDQHTKWQADQRENQTSKNVDRALQNEQRLLSAGLSGEIRVERWVTRTPRTVFVPIIGIVVQGNIDQVKLLET